MVDSARQGASAFFITPRVYFRTVLILSTLPLGAALAIEPIGDGAACGLCLYQRVPYIVVIVLSSLAIVATEPERPLNRFGMTLANSCMLGFFVVAGLAGFHYMLAENWVPIGDATRAALLNSDRAMLAALPDSDLAIWNAGIALACGILALMTLNRWESSERH